MNPRLFTEPCDTPCFYCMVMMVRLVHDGIEFEEARRMSVVRNHLGEDWPR